MAKKGRGKERRNRDVKKNIQFLNERDGEKKTGKLERWEKGKKYSA